MSETTRIVIVTKTGKRIPTDIDTDTRVTQEYFTEECLWQLKRKDAEEKTIITGDRIDYIEVAPE
jgi:hypothetical protein